jgi:hypothetical protein
MSSKKRSGAPTGDSDSKSNKRTKHVQSELHNPFLAEYTAYKAAVGEEQLARMFSGALNEEELAAVFAPIDYLTAQSYAWCIPSTEAVRVLAKLSPVVEIGAGSGYWGYMLKQMEGCVYHAFDIKTRESSSSASSSSSSSSSAASASASASSEGASASTSTSAGSGPSEEEEEEDAPPSPVWFDVKEGGPDVLVSQAELLKDCTLFLCYPDDFQLSEDSLALLCLEKFEGDTVVTAGEWFGESGPVPDQPYGKSFAPEFQERLEATFHCVLHLPLPSFRTSADSLRVWRRTNIVDLDADAPAAAEAESEEEEDVGALVFRDVPADEQLPRAAVAAPKYDGLLQYALTGKEE